MNGEVLQALLSAGIPSASATRLASAIDAAYAAKDSPAGGVSPPVQNSVNETGFDVYASGPASLQDGGPAFGKGKGALGVNGMAYISGEMYAGGAAHAQDMFVRGGASIGQGIRAAAGEFTNGLNIPGGAFINKTNAAFQSPIVAAQGIISKQGGQFSGDNSFLGPVTLGGKVFWGGEERTPATVDIVGLVTADGDSNVRVQRIKVAALNHYGDADVGGLNFTSGSPTVASVLADAAAVTTPGTATQVTTSPMTVVTNVSFDPVSCQITTTPASIYVVNSAVDKTVVAGVYITGDFTSVMTGPGDIKINAY